MNEEVWAELERLSRRMARIEIALTERIIHLEAEVAALKGQPQDTRTVYQDARSIEWRDSWAAKTAISEIMRR
uniref:Uncharacterized protein n=1 Tax=viral metagenome TaxID=1070528 RepID=A0A6M3J8R4_9ZZZZ